MSLIASKLCGVCVLAYADLSIVLKDGKSSAPEYRIRTFMVLMPSTVTESRLGFAPATEMFPAESVCTPACEVSVE